MCSSQPFRWRSSEVDWITSKYPHPGPLIPVWLLPSHLRLYHPRVSSHGVFHQYFCVHQYQQSNPHTNKTRALYLLTSWCRVLLEKLTGLQVVNKFPAFHGTRRFITALTSVRHLFLSWASPIQSIYPYPTSWRSTLILSTHLGLGLRSVSFPPVFPPRPYTPPLDTPSTKHLNTKTMVPSCNFLKYFELAAFTAHCI